jgi:hypothetical protein
MSNPDSCPGDRPENGAHPIDGFIHRRMTTILAARRKGESVRDPNSSVVQKVEELVEDLRYLGIDERRVKVGTNVARMDFTRAVLQIRQSRPEDFGAETA